jgi:aminopeptidase-like protein
LYQRIGGAPEARVTERALLWVLNLSDGQHTLLDIVERSCLTFDTIRTAADLLVAHGLLDAAHD